MTADEIIAALALQPHPEGGHFRETFRDPRTARKRAASTAIYYLLKSGERSHWHRIDAVEVWHWYAGAPLALGIAPRKKARAEMVLLGPDLTSGQRPQIVVPARSWQSAQSLGAWTLAGCTVAPGFQFERFELAPTGWHPGD